MVSERQAEYHKRYYLAHRDDLLARAKARYAAKRGPILAKLSEADSKAKRAAKRREIRDTVFAMYGSRCACCGEEAADFLTLDHIANDGAAKRRAMGGSSPRTNRSGQGFYEYIYRNGKQDDLQLLCFNCNCGKQRNGGVCPHEVLNG